MKISLLVAAVAVQVPAFAFAQPGQSGMTFLTLGVSARGLAMGDAMSALSSGAAATHYNPASLVPPDGESSLTQILFSHKEWIQDTRSEFLGASLPLGNDQTLGLSLNTTTVSDIEVRVRPGPSEGTFTARDFAVGVSYAQRIDPALTVGISAKFLYEKILIDEASGFAADAGVRWQTPVEHLLVGASVTNIGSMSSLRTEATNLPTMLRIGPAYTFQFEESQLSCAVGAELVRVFPDRQNLVNTGGEVIFDEFVAARAGYQFGSDSRGLTLGIGILYKSLALDYAYARVGSDLGTGHTISLVVTL